MVETGITAGATLVIGGPAMKPPSEDGGNLAMTYTTRGSGSSRNEATIRRWWKPGEVPRHQTRGEPRNEATIRRWWKRGLRLHPRAWGCFPQ